MKDAILVFDSFEMAEAIFNYKELRGHYFLVWTDKTFTTNNKFSNVILGLRNNQRSIKVIRRSLRNTPTLLLLPVVLISDHIPSLIHGEFDYVVNYSKIYSTGVNIFTQGFNSEALKKEIESNVSNWYTK